ncbi:PREDICTED: uncharacterized protein LOC107166657 [Diuraphis noxia]|uniref:uncharacterized protein LOC107166657 n=1 Tax=Diuraphis noxia TaxID=143948 RepID=UPI000763A672|nr:PREDICTED: uncharacterized protein LOC107166657 [Diuraphis noxia]
MTKISRNVECYHLRLLLHHVKGPTSYSFLKTVNNTEYPTFQATCRALGSLEDGNQWNLALGEAAVCRSTDKIRELFGKCIFLDSPGGTGKTHLINLLLAKVRSSYGIAIAAASSEIAATLLHGVKTAHSAFKLLLNLNTIETPTLLLRNLSPPKLCNGTPLRIIGLQKNLIEAIIMTGSAKGESVLIPRIPMIP